MAMSKLDSYLEELKELAIEGATARRMKWPDRVWTACFAAACVWLGWAAHEGAVAVGWVQ